MIPLSLWQYIGHGLPVLSDRFAGGGIAIGRGDLSHSRSLRDGPARRGGS